MTPGGSSDCSLVIPHVAAASRADLASLVTLALATTAAKVVEILLVGADADRSVPARGLELIRILPSPEQHGFAAAANAGAAAARGELVLFLDPTLQPRSDLLDALVRQAQRSPRTAVLAGKLLAGAGTIQQAGVVLDREGWPRRLYAGFPADHPAASRGRRLQIVSAACMLVRREIVLAAGGFDPTFAGEDAAYDLCLRLGEAGHEVQYVPEAVAVAGDSAQSLVIEEPAQLARSRRLFRTRWGHKIRHDDVACYQQDGLLQLQYDDGLPVRVIVAPPFEVTLPDGARNLSDRLLTARAHQVRTLLEENARLGDRVAALEALARNARLNVTPDRDRTRDSDADPDTDPDSDANSDAESAQDADPYGPIPPPELALSVGGQFREVGDEFLSYFIEIGGLRPTDRVLDVGCGVGRMAVPLTRYLVEPGTYDGFDITPRAISWCQTHIATRFPRFRFHCVPLRNASYNTEATARAAAFQFPYPPASFDFVLLTSVFTHLLPEDAQQYVSQISQALKPGGRCFATFFLLNPESQGLMQAGLSPQFPFAHRLDARCRIQDPSVPEAAVAYDEAQIRAWFDAAGLAITDPIRYGFWCGRADGLSLQDIVTASKA